MTAGVYLHIPFCKSRCSYCDFATDVYRSGEAVERYVGAICSEIGGTARVSEWNDVDSSSASMLPAYGGGTAVDSIYFGGGTPSLLTPEQVEKILAAVHEAFDVASDSEITMEMNPATVSLEILKEYRALGINRASYGVQTFNDRDLKLLARGHDADDARMTYRILRAAGFENISFDLIAGLPGQDLEGWKENLDEAFSMQPEHISLYLLEVHEGTPLAEQIRSGRQPDVDDDTAAAMYDLTGEYVSRSGYRQYEISNYSRPGFDSRHNSKYWTLDPVYGFGVSAHSFDGRERYSNIRDTNTCVQRVEAGDPPEASREQIDQASEAIFLGLRLNEGIDLDAYAEKYGEDIRIKFASELVNLTEAGLCVIENGHLRLTDWGRKLSNEVFQLFI